MSRPYRIVATSAGQHWDIETAAARAGGAEITVVACHTEDDLLAAGREADAILAGNEPFTRRVIEGLGRRVRVISRPAVGYDQVDVAAATARGIVVTHVPDYCTDEVSDHAFALLLALHRRVPWLDNAIKAGRWGQAAIYGGDRPATFHAGEVPGPPVPLRGQTLGIVGFGRIGRRLAEKARGFGLRLLATDPYVAPAAGEPLGVVLTDLDTLLRESDFVSIHCLLNAGTQGLIGAAQLALLKPTAQLINTARGPIVDLLALAEALQAGQLAAAALDVTEPEPLPIDHPLMTLPNVLLTPHSAYYSDRSRAEVRRRGVENALAVLRGETPNHAANPDVLARAGAAAVAAGDQ
ncbi:MAG: C-terminal binding protein [Thermomicrobiales bacterium]